MKVTFALNVNNMVGNCIIIDDVSYIKVVKAKSLAINNGFKPTEPLYCVYKEDSTVTHLPATQYAIVGIR